MLASFARILRALDLLPVVRMETLAKVDMSVSILIRLLEAAGYDLRAVKIGHVRTLDDILLEQRNGEAS